MIDAREFAGLTQQELAQKLEVTRYTIAAVELGLRDPSLKLMLAWVRALKLQPRLDYFATPHLDQGAA